MNPAGLLFLLLLLVVVTLVIPASVDPAIHLKEHNERRRGKTRRSS